MPTLSELNERWRQTGHVHAEPVEEQGHVWFCPTCETRGEHPTELIEAMSSALGHKKSCPAG